MIRAKYIYEKFTQDGDPIKNMGIGTIHELQKRLGSDYADGSRLASLSPNELLITSIYYQADIKDEIDLGNYAIEAGADQLWYDTDTRVAFPEILYKIIKFSYRNGEKRTHYIPVWCSFPKGQGLGKEKIAYRDEFFENFTPIVKNYIQDLNDKTNAIIKLKKAIKALQTNITDAEI